MRPAVLIVALLPSCVAAPGNSFGFDDQVVDKAVLPSRIAFGSCADQERPQPILREVVRRDPDLFVYLGDNVYGDTEDMSELRSDYETLAARPEFQALRSHCPTLAIWDDHDYGANDAGWRYPMKDGSREVFLDFWREPQDSQRRAHPGIFHDLEFRAKGRTLQVLLLDTRTFRDDLAPNAEEPAPPLKNAYRPNADPDATLLGEAQWRWLRERLLAPADLRIIATSIQFGHSYNGWESWTLFPRERERMIDLISDTRASGVVFISGDVHWGEINRQDVEGAYPLYDVTASGINQDWDVIEPSARRVGPAVAEHNVGFIEVDWDEPDPTVALLSVDVDGRERNRVEVRLSDLSFGPAAPSVPDAVTAAIEAHPGGEVLVAYRDLGSGEAWDVGGDTVVHAASTMKVPVLVALHRRAHLGKLDLDMPVEVRNEFRSIVDGSPYALDVADDSDEELYDHIGEEMPASELARRMIVRSSNLATNLLVDVLGAEEIQRTIEDLGVRDMRVLRGVEDIPAYRAGLSNTATARDLAVLLAAIAEGEAVSASDSAAMLAVLEAQEFNDLVPGGLPPGTRVAHKTGSITGIRHDAAVVLPDGEAPYVLVVLTRGFERTERAAEAIRAVAAAVHGWRGR